MTAKAPAALVACVAALAALTACAEEPEDALLADMRAGTVAVGVKYDQPGLGLRDPDGTMRGLDVEIADRVLRHVAEDHGWDAPRITWTETPTGRRETSLRQGRVNMVVASYTINEERARSVQFAGPYLLTHQALLVEVGSDVDGLEDLEGRTLCSVTGSTPAQTVQQEIPEVRLRELPTYSDCVSALRSGEVDAVTTDAAVLAGYADQQPSRLRVTELHRRNSDEPLSVERYGIGLDPGDKAGAQAVDEALREMRDNGEIAELIEENLGDAPGVSPAGPED